MAAAAWALIVLWPAGSFAFSVHGHEVVEATAYRKLLAETGIDDGTGRRVSGQEILHTLIRQGVLETPECFEPRPVDAERCAKERERRPVLLWPVIGSGAPDLLSSRQFSTNGQCFHFMAHAEDVFGTAKDANTGVPRGLSEDAYARCTRALGALFAEMLVNPIEANRNFRGMYSLMHSLADSFSEAHVERDAQWNVGYLKPWRLVTVLPYSFHWSGWSYFVGPSHHAAFVESRDKGFVIERPDCQELKHPYAVHDDCVSERGHRASRALVDLLVLTYRLRRRAQTVGAGHIAERDVSESWRDFLLLHTRNPRMAPDLRRPFWNENEWLPAYVLGFRFRPEPLPGTHDLAFFAGTTLFSDVTLPLTPFFSFEAGCRRIEGVCHLMMAGDVALMLPLTEHLSLGTTPLSILGHVGGANDGAVVGFNLGRADLHLFDALWLSVTGPRYSWVSQGFDAELVSLTMGFAWNGKRDPVESEANASEAGLRLRLDQRRLHPIHDRAAEEWRLPPLGEQYGKRKTTAVLQLLGGTVLSDHEAGAYSIGGFGLYWDRDQWGLRSGFAFGLRADTEYHVTRDHHAIGVNGGPALRVYVVTNLLALELNPILADIGYQKARDGSHERTGAFSDFSAQARLVVNPVGRTEISIESPRFSYLARERVVGTNLGLRLGILFE